MRSSKCVDCLIEPAGACRRHRDPAWVEFAPDVRRLPHPAFRPLPEPIPERNVLAVCVDFVLIGCLLIVVVLAYFGRLDWLLNLVDLLHR